MLARINPARRQPGLPSFQCLERENPVNEGTSCPLIHLVLAGALGMTLPGKRATPRKNRAVRLQARNLILLVNIMYLYK